jgi:glycosyltransferase involved in cell wall biosynthesis
VTEATGPVGGGADPHGRKRAVVLVGGPANPYSRATRIGRTLSAAGYDVEIAATTERGAPTEERDGDLLIRRYRPSGWIGRLTSAFRAEQARAAGDATTGEGGTRAAARPSRLVMLRRTLRARFVKWVFWPHTVRGWWHTLAMELEPADLYHSCGVLPIAAALAARDRDRKAGRRSRVILDTIDVTMESNNVLDIPPLVLRILKRRERNWARRADAHTAINEPFARRVAESWGLDRAPTVVPNYPEPASIPDPSPDLIRDRLGLPSTTSIAVFWGRLGPNLGLDEMAEAVLRVPDTALVLLGFGRGRDRSLARDADPRFEGRHFTLPAVHPDDLARWVASADVALVTLPAISYNQRFTTPNKFLEAMAAGVPMVLGPDLPTMEGILREEDLGRVAATMDADHIANAIREILALPADERRAWRARIAATARERYSWPAAAAAYRRVLEELGQV